MQLVRDRREIRSDYRAELFVKANATIFPQGDRATWWCAVVSGGVRLCNFRIDGSRQITRFVFPGESFGLSRPARTTAAEAICACTLRRRFEPLTQLTELRDCAVETNQALLSALQCANSSLEVVGRRGANARVAAFLLDAFRRTGSNPVLPFAITRSDIADFLNLTVFTVSRAMAEFLQAGLIAPGGSRRIRLSNLDAIAGVAGLEPMCGRSTPCAA